MFVTMMKVFTTFTLLFQPVCATRVTIALLYIADSFLSSVLIAYMYNRFSNQNTLLIPLGKPLFIH